VRAIETENELLQFLLERDKLDKDDVLKDLEIMKHEKILNQHKENYKVWQANDGRWKTKLPDGSKYGKLVAKSTLENLENCIVDFYKTKQTKKGTLQALYPDWLEYKRKETSEGNANKLQWVWNTYYEGTNSAQNKIQNITTIMVKEFALDTVAKFQLTERKYEEFKSLINSMFDYAIDSNLVTVNVARNVRGINKRKLKPEDKKSVSQQIYIENEKCEIIALALQQYQKTKNTAYLVVCMNFYLGLRVGELVALHTDDFSNNQLFVHRQEIKTYTVANGVSKRNGYRLVDYTKTEESTRTLLLVSEAQKYYQMILKANEERGFNNGFLVLHENGERMHDFSINNVLRRLNRKIVTPQKGNHGIRKTCFSAMAKSKAVTEEEIMHFAGHKDYNTTKTYYIFDDEEPNDRTEAFEKALCGGL